MLHVLQILIQMFQGFSWLDIGFYMSGYQHFTDEPYVSYFLGQWLLSFQLTSWLCKTFSIDSYLGLRVLHLIFVVLSQTVIYLYLRRYIRGGIIISGMLLATLAHFGSYTEINYNDYSAGLLTLAVMAYHHGFARDRLTSIFLSGVFVGAAFYFRIVNITFIGIPFLAWLISYKYDTKLKTRHQFAAFFTGTAAACAAVTISLYATGMLDVFNMTVRDILTRSHDPQDPHGVKAIIISIYELYQGQIQGFSVIALLIFLIALCRFRLRGMKRDIATAILSLLIIPNIYLWESPSNITVGICLAASAFLFARPETKDGKASLYLLSMFIPLVLPIGSNAGPDFYGKDMCFMTLPAALGVICEGAGKLKSAYQKPAYTALRTGYAFICIAMIYTNMCRPMMEESTRMRCRFTIDSPLTRHIYTSEKNARLNNYITLDKGTADGVYPEMGVVGQNGVVGIVTVANEHNAVAISVLNPKLRISCKVKGTDCFGSLVWDGRDSRYAVLEEMPRHVEFEPGDTIVTSGYSAVFPEGVMVGTIHAYSKQKDDNFYAMQVALSTDFSRLGVVRVIQNPEQEARRQLEKEARQ